jgi:SAM-dependent methyltransferase
MAQFDFLRDALPRQVRSVLVIGCGSGQGAHFVATRVARQARVLGVDISPASIAIAEKLFAHSRIEYRCMDVATEGLSGVWEVIVFPDVYEHIPVAARPGLHQQLRSALAPNGLLLLTLPSRWHQEMLHVRGSGLQIVDETVTLEDLQQLARDIDGNITYYAMVSVWGGHDYVHAVLERGRSSELPIGGHDRVPIHRCQPPLRARLRLVAGRNGLLYYPWRYLRVAGMRRKMARREPLESTSR